MKKEVILASDMEEQIEKLYIDHFLEKEYLCVFHNSIVEWDVLLIDYDVIDNIDKYPNLIDCHINKYDKNDNIILTIPTGIRFKQKYTTIYAFRNDDNLEKFKFCASNGIYDGYNMEILFPREINQFKIDTIVAIGCRANFIKQITNENFPYLEKLYIEDCEHCDWMQNIDSLVNLKVLKIGNTYIPFDKILLLSKLEELTIGWEFRDIDNNHEQKLNTLSKFERINLTVDDQYHLDVGRTKREICSIM
jgi:hypothetical protein